MEFADKGDLFQKITLCRKSQAHFEEVDIWKIFIQMVKGLKSLHELKILHRDLKSANIFLFSDGIAKLGDLNVSKVSPRGLSCTQTGTPIYASPEVWKDNPYDLKSDIWSLGVVTYEMIMLKAPFTAKSMEELYKKIMKGKYPEIKNYSESLKYVISLLLEVNPLYRPDTKQILTLKEVKLKNEEYKIFKNYNYEKIMSYVIEILSFSFEANIPELINCTLNVINTTEFSNLFYNRNIYYIISNKLSKRI